MTGPGPSPPAEPPADTVPGLDLAVSVEDPRWAALAGQAGIADLEQALAPLVRAALAGAGWPPLEERTADRAVELTVVLADDALVQRLNRDYRGIDKPTNVLSFALAGAPAEDAVPEPHGPLMLGDVIIAYDTAVAEATAEHKPPLHHLFHLVVHGVLHLLGHEHQGDAEAHAMERLEAVILERFGIADPYAAGESPDQTTGCSSHGNERDICK